MFPLYFNALLKEDGSLTKNSDGSYSLVFTNVKNNVVLYQTWDGHNPTFNQKQFKVFSLTQSQLAISFINYNKAVENIIKKEDQAGYMFTPTMLIRLNEKEYWVKATNYKVEKSQEDPLSNGYTVTYTLSQELNTLPDNYNGQVNMILTQVLYSMVSNANPNTNFLKWLDMGAQNTGSFDQTKNINLVNNEYNVYLENEVEISQLSNNNYKISITNPNVVLFYQIWNKLTPLSNKEEKRTTAYTSFSEFYRYFNSQRDIINDLNIKDKNGYYYNPAANLRLIKNGAILPFLVEITDISFEEQGLNELSTFNMTVNTSKFEMYNSNLKIQLPVGKFDMTMNIDAPAPPPGRRGNGDSNGVDGGMELAGDILEDILPF